MSISIDSVTIGSIEDRRLVLGNAQAAAPILIGGLQSNNWVRIRLAARLAWDDVGSNPGTVGFWMGVMSNPTADGSGFLSNGPLNAPTSHFLGLRIGAPLNRYVGPPAAYIFPSTASYNLIFASRVGTTNTLQTAAPVSGGSSGLRFSATPATHRQVFMLELTKGATTTSWKGRISHPCHKDVSDIALANFNAALEPSDLEAASTVLSPVNMAQTVTTLSGLTVDEGTNGPLNAIVIGWDRGSGETSLKLRLSDFNYVLFSS